MKHFIVILFIVIAVFQFQYVQSQASVPLQYGFSFSGTSTGSGHGSNIVLNFVALDNQKAMEFGAIIRPDNVMPKGVEFKYKIYFGKTDFYVNQMMIRPFAMYNCLYQNETTIEPMVLETVSGPLLIPDNQAGTISTMEHYIGIGLHFRFLNNFFINTSTGIGAYIGSLTKLETPETIGIHKYNRGWTGTFKISAGLLFL